VLFGEAAIPLKCVDLCCDILVFIVGHLPTHLAQVAFLLPKVFYLQSWGGNWDFGTLRGAHHQAPGSVNIFVAFLAI